ncbi:MAG TPA: DNA-binding response regulator [Chloroflexi bacterium]|nr:DNA-binding response regulator [Chloroflexota bacterium]HHW87734.1 response regulator transcription factor [Chloroflexota bacterium]
MPNITVLLVEDDPAILRMVQYLLTDEGMTVVTARNGLEGLRCFYAARPDLVILDLMMPELDGWETCQRIRELADVPILMLTARGQDEDMVRGLSTGADDYMVKPFSPEVLVARIQALLRRTGWAKEAATPVVFSDERLQIDLEARRVTVAGKPIRLTATEFQLLAYLVANAGRVLTFRQILENVWGWEYQDDTQFARLYTWRLRQKLEQDPKNPNYILTEYGVGYRFEKPVRAN